MLTVVAVLSEAHIAARKLIVGSNPTLACDCMSMLSLCVVEGR